MTGALWAAVSGLGFGVFQVLNARAVRGLASVYLATFVQLLAATTVFVVIVGVDGRAGRLLDVPASALLLFGLAGLLHFFIGWTTMSQSQARIGAARTSPLIATSPLFGVVLALVAGQLPAWVGSRRDRRHRRRRLRGHRSGACEAGRPA